MATQDGAETNQRSDSLFLGLYRYFFYLFVALNTCVLGITIILLAFIDTRGNLVYYIGRFWSRMNLAFAGVRVSVKGKENIHPRNSYIVMSNHQSLVDVWVAIAYLPLQLRWVMKMELRKVPVFGLACERMGHIFVDRKSANQSHENLAKTKRKFENGASVFFFPEGSRSTDGQLKPFKKGGFYLSLLHSIPILPVTINGTREILPKGSMKWKPGQAEMIIQPPVSPTTFKMEDKAPYIEAVREKILAKKK